MAIPILLLGYSAWENEIRPHPTVNLSREFDAGILVMFLIVVLTGIKIVRTERNESA